MDLIVQGKEGRDEQLEHYKTCIRAMGKARIVMVSSLLGEVVTIGTLGLPLKGQIAFLLTYAGASKWMSPRDATAPQSGRQLPFPTAHREFFWIAAGSPPFRIHPSQGGREGKRGAGVPCIFPHARNAGRTGGYGASMRMSH